MSLFLSYDLFQSILAQLGAKKDSSNVKCDNVSDFTRMLVQNLGAKRAVIHLENGDRLRDDLSLLSVFTRIQVSSTECNFLWSRISWKML